MNQPLESLSAPRLPPSSKRSSTSKRRASADFAELVWLERAAKRACFVPIPRSVSRLIESSESVADDRTIKLNDRQSAVTGSGLWVKNGASLASLAAPGTGNDAVGAGSVMLVVDQRLAMHFGSRAKTKSVVAAEIAAFIAWRALAQDARIGALVFNDRKIDFLFPNNTRLSVMLILHAIVNQNHALAHNGKGSSNSDMLNRALRRLERTAKDSCTIFLITDASGYSEETRRLLASISQRTHLCLLLISDPRQKKLSKTRWQLSRRFIHDSKRRAARDEIWLSLENGGRSRVLSDSAGPGKIPVLRFSTWESAVELLRRAARKSILPPKDRPAQPARHHNGNQNGKHNVSNPANPKDIPLPLNGSALTSSPRYRPQL